MDERLGILFLHHNSDPVTLQNLASIKAQNPDATIATISSGQPLPNGYALDQTPELQKIHATQPHKRSDTLVCSWFLQKKETCDRWWIVEWDVYAEVSVREYYRRVWDFRFVASVVHYTYREFHWHWFEKLETLAADYKSHQMGASPFLYLLTEPVLAATCRMLIDNPIPLGNAEFRFATAANRCGFPPCGYSPPGDRITWMPWFRLIGPPTIFHPVKHLVDYR